MYVKSSWTLLWHHWNDSYYSEFVIAVIGVPGEPIPVSSEQDIFEIIGMDYKEPTERNLWGKLRPKSHW